MDGFGDNFVPNGDGGVDPAAEFLAREQNELAGIDDSPPIIAAESEESTFPTEDEAAAPDEQLFQTIPEEVAAEPIAPVSSQSSTERSTPNPRIEPEAIRIWREEHQRTLVEKDAAEEKAKEALREKARQELEEWYRQHDEQVAKTRQTNREAAKCAEKELVADTEPPEPGTEWERISKLCDFNPKTARSSRDVSRMRSIILHVKQNPPMKA